MAALMIGVDRTRARTPPAAIALAGKPLGELPVRACAVQAERLLASAAAWPERTRSIEGAAGLGILLARQLPAGERRAGRTTAVRDGPAQRASESLLGLVHSHRLGPAAVRLRRAC